MTTHTILLVDDDPTFLLLLQALLRNEDYKVLTCDDPDNALRFAKEAQIDLIVSDHHMPALTGNELLALAARLQPNVRRIMVSAATEFDVVRGAVNHAKVDAFIRKTDVPTMFVREVKSALAIGARA